MAIEYKKTPEVEEAKPPSPPPPEPVKVEAPVVEPPDLLVTSSSLLHYLLALHIAFFLFSPENLTIQLSFSHLFLKKIFIFPKGLG